MVGKCSASQKSAETRDRTGDLQIFSLTLSQLSYRGSDEGHLALDKGNSWPIVFSTLPARGTSCSPRVCECVYVCVCVHVCIDRLCMYVCGMCAMCVRRVCNVSSM